MRVPFADPPTTIRQVPSALCKPLSGVFSMRPTGVSMALVTSAGSATDVLSIINFILSAVSTHSTDRLTALHLLAK